jgi:hypothetical protein
MPLFCEFILLCHDIQFCVVKLHLYDIGAVGMRLLTKYMNDEKIEEPNVVLPHRIEYIMVE